ncbi:MAG: glycosyltransferase family 39 protein [Acidobacteria bacterium]|nr:glycosyltransferase family 39 protein [Acidobacteriota bacterium]
MLPFVRNDWLWQTGLAGSIPSAACFVAAGLFLFGAVRRTLGQASAACAVALFILNPNVLYMQSIAMTEAPFFAAFFATLYFTVRFRDSQSLASVAGAGIASAAAALIRYEGWFVIPFVAVYFLLAAPGRRILSAGLFCLLAGLAPAYWLAHNYWFYSDALEFVRGPWSAKAIYQRALDKGMDRYGGDGDWWKAWLYFHTAARLAAGSMLFWIAAAGMAATLIKRAVWPLVFLLLPVVFYLWSIHSSGTPIFVPELWPSTYYNTRYGLAAYGLIVFAAAALVALTPARVRFVTAWLLPVLAVLPWLLYPRADSWVCWKESQVNSAARRQWTAEGAAFFQANLRPGDGIFTTLSDLSGILTQARIPFRRTLQEGNGPAFVGATLRPDLFLHEQWALAISGDTVATSLLKGRKPGVRFECVKIIAVPGAPVIEIYRRRP